MKDSVAIVIPVFNGLSHLKRLFSTLLENTPEPECRFVVVDDASTDPEVVELLKRFAARDVRVEIIRNRENVGFVKSTNRGLRAAEGAHCVLLNSDTEVPYGWLPRLLRPIIDDPNIATSTPFSNGAVYFSLPVWGSDNRDVMSRFSVREIDDIVSTFVLPKEQSVAPIGHGCCLAMNRAAISRVGLLDEVTFGRGYGEEVDWCRRASAAGFKHVVAFNLFVAHYHCGSFQSNEKSRLSAEHVKIINERYPDLASDTKAFRQGNCKAWLALGRQLVDRLAARWNSDGRLPRRILFAVPALNDAAFVCKLLRTMVELRDAGDIAELWYCGDGQLRRAISGEGFFVTKVGWKNGPSLLQRAEISVRFDLAVCWSFKAFRLVRHLRRCQREMGSVGNGNDFDVVFARHPITAQDVRDMCRDAVRDADAAGRAGIRFMELIWGMVGWVRLFLSLRCRHPAARIVSTDHDANGESCGAFAK